MYVTRFSRPYNIELLTIADDLEQAQHQDHALLKLDRLILLRDEVLRELQARSDRPRRAVPRHRRVA